MAIADPPPVFFQVHIQQKVLASLLLVCHWHRGARMPIPELFSLVCSFLLLCVCVCVWFYCSCWGGEHCNLLALCLADALNQYFSPGNVILCLAQVLNSCFPTGFGVVRGWLPKRKPRFSYQMTGEWTLRQGKNPYPELQWTDSADKLADCQPPKYALGFSNMSTFS